MRQLVVCIDGTWNSPAEETRFFSAPTNVRRISELLINDDAQRVFYLRGVGTDSFTDRIIGGGWGSGTERRIRDGYRTLCEHWRPRDKIALVGFSRGAFAARWITGVMANVGILRPGALDLVEQAISIGTRPAFARNEKEIREFVDKHCYPDQGRPLVDFVGVFDTVVRYGPFLAPLRMIAQGVTRRHIGLRDHIAPRIVSRIAHALALDECRVAFPPWRFGPERPNGPGQIIEEVWFAGSHSDVGGGYVDSESSEIPLRWMAERADEAGLRFKEMPRVGENSYRAPLHPSRTGFWRLFPPLKRVIHESDCIHPSAKMRMKAIGYQPIAQLPSGEGVTGHRSQAVSASLVDRAER